MKSDELLRFLADVESGVALMGKLSLSGHSGPIGAKGCVSLCHALTSNYTIHTLDIRLNKIGDDGARALGQMLKSNAVLRSVVIDSNEINAIGGAALADAMQTNKTLTSLSLRCNNLGQSAGAALLRSLVDSGLVYLDLSSNSLTGETWPVLGDLLESNTSLQTVILSQNRLGDKLVPKVAIPLRVNSTLKTLDLAGTCLSHHGGMVLRRALEDNSALTHMDLTFNTVGKNTLDAITDLLIRNNIRSPIHVAQPRTPGVTSSPLAPPLVANVSTPLTSFASRRPYIGDADGSELRAQIQQTLSGGTPTPIAKASLISPQHLEVLSARSKHNGSDATTSTPTAGTYEDPIDRLNAAASAPGLITPIGSELHRLLELIQKHRRYIDRIDAVADKQHQYVIRAIINTAVAELERCYLLLLGKEVQYDQTVGRMEEAMSHDHHTVAQLQAALNERDTMLRDMDEHCTTAAETIKTLRSSEEQHLSDLDKLERERDQLVQERPGLLHQIASLQEAYRKEHDLSAELQDLLQKMHSEAEREQHQVKGITMQAATKLQELQEELRAKKTECSVLRDALLDKDVTRRNETALLQSKLQEMQAQIDELKAEARRKAEGQLQAELKVDEIRKRLTQSEQQRTVLSIENERLVRNKVTPFNKADVVAASSP
eukprot:TRINITY_DN9214_c0_g1_i2.p1 TRINITY_DN9214_c0_g1~~TRINITY_DN9214_c0_g1_i2.p1  ORF type:complete len:660 (-),score=177.37 TRINITY_DN9214_c0_g1_i2:737-2716(-)